ncbi:MAG: hypothetical protein ABIT36_02640 [Steroidobacteraceae bacterium]
MPAAEQLQILGTSPTRRFKVDFIPPIAAVSGTAIRSLLLFP